MQVSSSPDSANFRFLTEPTANEPQTACAQRSSPQFSFPPPGAIASQFGADVFGPSSSLSQDLGQPTLVQIGASQQQPSQQPSQQSQSQQQQAQQQQQQAQAQQQAQQSAGQGDVPSSLIAQSPAAPSPVGLQLTRPRQTQSVPAASQVSASAAQQPHQSARHHAQAVSAPTASASQSASSAHRSSTSSSSQQNAHREHSNKLHTQQTSQSAAAGSQQSAIEAARRAEATAASLAATSGQSYHCPDSFGFFRHHKSCDKYWACENGTSTLKLCGNGLMFDDSDPKRENCAYPFSVDCGSDRTDLGE